MAIRESPRWQSQGDTETQSLQLDSEGHTETPPTLTSTPLKQGYVCFKNIDTDKAIPVYTSGLWRKKSTTSDRCFSQMCAVLLTNSTNSTLVVSPVVSHVSVQRQHQGHSKSLADPGWWWAAGGARPDRTDRLRETVRWETLQCRHDAIDSLMFPVMDCTNVQIANRV